MTALAEGAMKVSSLQDFRLTFEALLFTVLVPGTVTVAIPWWILGPTGRQLPGVWTVFEFGGVGLLVLGGVIYVWCVRDFVSRGRGIPAPLDPPKELVVTGLYRHVRNPMYLGVLLLLLGEVVLFRSRPLLLYTAAWFLVVNAFVLFYEEPTLRRRFGESYERYAAEVARWVPRWRPGPPDPTP